MPANIKLRGKPAVIKFRGIDDLGMIALRLVDPECRSGPVSSAAGAIAVTSISVSHGPPQGLCTEDCSI